VSFDPYAPYGPLVETTTRVVTWNVWGRYGDVDERQRGIEQTLAAAAPDLICLTEAWATEQTDQAEQLGECLDLEHRCFVGDLEQGGWRSGIGLVSRWPIVGHEHVPLPGDDGLGVGSGLFATIDGPRGPLQLLVAMLDHPLGASALRQAQVRQLAEFAHRSARRRHPLVLCGDFNAGPDSDELRMLTGRRAVPVPDLVFYDAWEIAGDATPGHTWSNRNPLAAVALWPDRRIDHILSAWPRAGGAGHPVRCELLGVTERPEDVQLSDHYGLVADLRY